MSWITFIWSANAGICLALAGMHLMVWVRSRNNWAYLLFSVAATGAAGCAVFELALMYSQTPVQYGEALRWIQLPAQIMIVSLLWFVKLYLQAGRLWLAWMVSGLRGVWLVLSFCTDLNLNFRIITGLKRLSVWGETIVITAIGEKHPWTNINNVGTLLFLFFVLDSCLTAWRQGDRRRVVGVGGPIAFAIALGIVQSVLLVRGMLPMPVMLSFLFLIIVIGIAYQLSDDLLRVNQISRELQETQERMQLVASAADLGMWEWDVDRDIFWLNETSRARTGAGESERITFERILKSIHPEDREPIRRAAYLSIEDGRMFESECRIIIPEGSTRWMAMKGQVVRSLNGKSVFTRGVTMDITDRKIAENDLLKSEEKFRRLVENIPDVIWTINAAGKTKYISDNVRGIFGVSPEDVYEHSELWLDRIHPDDCDRVVQEFSLLFRNGEPFDTEYRIRHKDGHWIWLHDRSMSAYEKDGVTYADGLFSDITFRKQAEEELQKSRDYLAHVINSIPDAVFSVKLPERTIEWARDSYNVLGHDLDALIGKDTERIYSNLEEYQAFGEMLKNAIQDKKDNIIAEVLLRNGNGEAIPAEINTTIYREKGEAASVISLVRDISLRKKIQVALENSEARLKEAQRLAHIGDWELDLLTDELSWSDEVFRIFEIDRDRFGASYAFFLSAIHPEDRDAVNAAYTQSLKTSNPYSISHRLMMPDGRVKYVHEQCETIYDTDGKPLRSVGTVQDITERQQAANERIRLRNELVHLNRIMTISELSHSLAHEINQPLGAIMNNAAAAKSIMYKYFKGNGDLMEILEDIIKDTNRAGQIIRKIRGMVKKEETQLESLNMETIIKEVVDLFKNAFSIDHIFLQLDIHPDLPPIRGDRVRLQQVLTNLISNAMEAMGTAASKNLTIRSALEATDRITVSVSDSGAGIDENIKDKIFQPFFTTKKGGLGIGLRLCRSIIEEHGGRIWMENNPQGGTTFLLSLKAYQGESP